MYFLIDFENVKNLGMRGSEVLEPEDGVILFFSDTSSRIERRYLQDIEKSGCAFEAYKLVKQHKNALDFYIAAKSGELFGGGYQGTVAIISKDGGFKAVRDYWTCRARPTRRVVICESIERAILAAGGPIPRVRSVSSQIATLGIEAFYRSMQEKRRLREMIERQFSETPLADRLEEIGVLVGRSKTRRELYLSALRTFGKEDGLLAYRGIKEQIVFDPAPKGKKKAGNAGQDNEQPPATASLEELTI